MICPNFTSLVQAAIAQLAARRSHNPKVVSSILTRRTLGSGISRLVAETSETREALRSETAATSSMRQK